MLTVVLQTNILQGITTGHCVKGTHMLLISPSVNCQQCAFSHKGKLDATLPATCNLKKKKSSASLHRKARHSADARFLVG